jgi:hypothetical protein
MTVIKTPIDNYHFSNRILYKFDYISLNVNQVLGQLYKP